VEAELRPGKEVGTWTRDFVKRMACAKFLDATAPWTAAARRAARLREGGGTAAAAAGPEAERLWRRRRWCWWCGAIGRRREKKRRRDGEEGGMGWGHWGWRQSAAFDYGVVLP
jgi:hypothetical protein